MFLLFDTQADATEANNKIAQNMGCNIVGKNAKTRKLAPHKQQTTSWAILLQDKNGKWYIPKPDDSYMTGVTGYTTSSLIEVNTADEI